MTRPFCCLRDEGENQIVISMTKDITGQEESEKLDKFYRLLGRAINRSKTVKQLAEKILKGLKDTKRFFRFFTLI